MSAATAAALTVPTARVPAATDRVPTAVSRRISTCVRLSSCVSLSISCNLLVLCSCVYFLWSIDYYYSEYRLLFGVP